MPMMFWDPTMILLIPAIILSLYAQTKVSSTFKKYAQVLSEKGITGAQAARAVLNNNGLHDVRVEAVRGHLSDHYDPRTKVVRLSEPIYGSSSIAALGVAVHECGHAIQDYEDYAPMRFRSALAPIAQFGSYGSWIILLMGIFLQATGLIKIGIIIFCVVVLFQIVTLPVEFNASSRALTILSDGGFLTTSEVPLAKKVLSAAAMTYVAAAFMAILELVRFIILSGILRNDD